MKKILLFSLLLLVIALATVAFIFVGSGTGFDGKKETLYIASGAATKSAVLDSLEKRSIVKNTSALSFLASRMGYWSKIRPGRYEIKRGASLLSIVRMLRNGQQTPVSLVITKLRTKENLARLAGSKFEFDSAAMMAYLESDTAMKAYALEPGEVMAFVLPDTYLALWNSSPAAVFKKLVEESKKFWNAERKQKAQGLGLTPVQAVTVASIVEEETNADAEKGTVASVYLNRVRVGMPLQADPTVKFALKDFGIKRIYEKHLQVESPYNTYRNRGLPPGPICTPSKKTIDAVLNAPATDYIYFVASPKFNGTHEFSVTYSEHLGKARAYQAALNRQDSIRKKLL